MKSDNKKVLVAMSGGVDSSVAAQLLLADGYDVAGAHLHLAPNAADHTHDVRNVADALGIELHIFDLTDRFASIIDYFAAEYACGRTPNPCIRCNALIKFGHLLKIAEKLGIYYIATGHHARLAADDAGAPAICRGRTRQKDQSYALFAVAAESLPRILLPIGEVDNKDSIRAMARQLGLSVHDKRDSQEICFVPDDDYSSLLGRLAPEALRAGKIVNAAGEQLGTHDGYGRFTLGQRRGVGIAAGEPMYVTRIDPSSATITIGPKDEVLSDFLTASGANWHSDPPDEFDAVVQVRYNHPGTPGRVKITGPATFEVRFAEPVHAVTPGQAAVAYDGQKLLGGGWID